MNTIQQELHTLADFVRWGASRFNEMGLFFGHGTDNAIDEAIVLLSHVLHLPPQLPDTLWQARLTIEEKNKILALFDHRMKERIPTPYLIHEAWFAGLRFYVDRRVLIPRSPIAELIENQFSPWVRAEKVNTILDLCTGSGCIAIACALLAFPEAEIDAVDISLQALEVAQKNISNYDLDHRVHAIESDLFTRLQDKRYDLIVCNPPYVSLSELSTIPPEFRHEPILGLEGGEDGLDTVKKLLQEAHRYLTPHGVLIVEVGNSQYTLVERYPNIPFTWLDFTRGGDGVFLLTKEQLLSCLNQDYQD